MTLRRCVLLTLLPQQLVFSDRRGTPSVFYKSADESQSSFLGSASHYLGIIVRVPDSSSLLVKNTRPGGLSVWKKNTVIQRNSFVILGNEKSRLRLNFPAPEYC